MNVAIVGATGYTGLELVRILSAHPAVTVTALTSERYAGRPYGSVYPFADEPYRSMLLTPLEPDRIADSADIIFTALPHRESMKVVPLFYGSKKLVIDLSADYRLKNTVRYEKWYQKHTSPELLEKSVYGLPELYRKKIRRAGIVANPGCYPTSIILPLMPLIKEGLIAVSSIIADSKSGVSGAGRSLKVGSLYCEAAESFKPYSPLQHRHQPEIEEQLSSIADRRISLTFVPHLIPMNRGMLSTLYVTLRKSCSEKKLLSCFEKYYKNEPFIRLLPFGTVPQTSWVRGTNDCAIGFALQGKRLVLFSAIDNLVKGASGQAVQNMNIMLGIEEKTGLALSPAFP